MVQLYIKYIDNEYYLLDLDPKESINLKHTAKDLTDITKTFSPFTQSFNLPPTDKNKMLCGFIGNEKIQRINNDGIFDALLYVGGFLFQSGKLSFDATSYEYFEQQGFKTSFSSTLSGIGEALGDLTIQDIFLDVNNQLPADYDIYWDGLNLRRWLGAKRLKTLPDSSTFRYSVPFIFLDRFVTYDPNNLALVDNIAYNATNNGDNGIRLSDVRPSISFYTIINKIIEKAGLTVTCPLFVKNEYKDLDVWCSNETMVDSYATSIVIRDYAALSYTRYNYYTPPDVAPTNPRWVTTLNTITGVFTVTRTGGALPNNEQQRWGNGFDIRLKINGLTSLDNEQATVKITLRRVSDNSILYSQDNTGSDFYYRAIDDLSGWGNTGVSIFTGNTLDFYFEILPITLVDFTTISVSVKQMYSQYSPPVKGDYTYVTTNSNTASELGVGKINLIAGLPKTKAKDFLKSFFKTFNISVIPTGLPDQSMYWLTPSDINEYNKGYSKRIVDYTPYVDVSSVTKERGNKYNLYKFAHKESKYFDAVYGDGTRFGELKYPTITPAKPTAFDVKTDFSIIKPNGGLGHPLGIGIGLAFSKETPTVGGNGGLIYKGVYGELTVFYGKLINLRLEAIGVEDGSSNLALTQIIEPNFVSSNGKSLAFGGEGLVTDSLYANYYQTFIELLLSPNTYLSTFKLELPPNEIFLNFANTAQGQSNIPTGFRVQNEIVIGEQRYQLVDSAIDVTNGDTKITALNF